MRILQNGFCSRGNDCSAIVDRERGFQYLASDDRSLLKIERSFSENEVFQLELNPESSFLKLALIDLRRTVPEQKYLALDLFVRQCSQNP